MISISTSGLAYRIGTRDILTDVTFSLEDGDKLAVVGVNGSGKSTLLRLICGEYTPDEGSVYLAKNKTVGMLHQDDAFNILKLDTADDDSSPVDETVLGQMYAVFPELCRWEVRLARLQEELDRAAGGSDVELLNRLSAEFTNLNNRFIADGGLHYKSRCRSILVNLGFDESYHNMPVTALSGGQRTRLALARLLSQEPDILILDEPTNHLDLDTMAWLEEHLAAYKKTVILVSHDRLFLDRVTNKTLEIEHTTSKLYKCSYSQYVVEKEAYRREMEKKYNLQQKEIARLEAYIAQQRAWNRERNIIAAESREKAIARMEKVEKPKALPKAISFKLQTSGESGNDVLEVKRLAMGFGTHMLFRDLSFLIKKRERVFITGPNGCGKSTLIKLFLGQLDPLGGTIEFGYNVTVGYYDQENQKLDPENTVLDELWNAYPNLTQTEVRNTLAMFMFRGDDIEKEVAVLSGGERARLTLAKLILSRMNLLILDEPTNHLDIDSREALETALAGFDGTIIAVSHDRYFTKKLATQFIDIGDGGRLYRGSYDEYMAHLAARKSGKPVTAEVKEESVQKEEFEKRKLDGATRRRNEKRKVQIAREIGKLEEELIAIEEELFGDAASDYIRVSELTDRKITVEDLLMQLYEEEEELNSEE